MFRILFLLFLAVPLLEIYLLIKVGSIIGAGWTVLLVIFTAVLGAWLLRLQGLSTYRNVQIQMARGEVPAVTMLEGLFLFISGALLLTPGFFTDAIGFAMLIPPLRRAIALWLLERSVFQTIGGAPPGGGPHQHRQRHPHHPHVIEGEYQRRDD